MLKFHRKLEHLYSVAENGEIGIWNSVKMTKFEVHKTPKHFDMNKVNTCTFYEPYGTIIMATTKLYMHDLQKFENMHLSDKKQISMAKEGMKQFMAKLCLSGVFGEEAKKDAVEWQQEHEKQL